VRLAEPGLSAAAEFCFELIVSGGPAGTRTDACSDSAQGRAVVALPEMPVSARLRDSPIVNVALRSVERG
jgi:hypothetical protein